ncbi:hypothetical protein [Bacteroides cellulosilyticus]|uniref:hypothetical protein n=1 Tax=Bacteroides cellulosilyticus TaxID=246787 RepID=UPI00101DC05F|nr:hypothetical protein [Bacteroides cellulosilyticus]
MSICSYKLDQVFYGEGATVRQVYGQVPVVQKVTISGKRKTVTKWKSLRWNDAGQCFSLYSTQRQRNYDLPLRSVEEQQKMSKGMRLMYLDVDSRGLFSINDISINELESLLRILQTFHNPNAAAQECLSHDLFKRLHSQYHKLQHNGQPYQIPNGEPRLDRPVPGGTGTK